MLLNMHGKLAEFMHARTAV